jgi:PIN domain nuclease of toxin-antitoxin system
VRILLDTSTFLWAAGLESRLSARAEMLFQDPETAMYLSAISISEIAIKHGKGNLSFGLHDALVY